MDDGPCERLAKDRAPRVPGEQVPRAEERLQGLIGVHGPKGSADHGQGRSCGSRDSEPARRPAAQGVWRGPLAEAPANPPTPAPAGSKAVLVGLVVPSPWPLGSVHLQTTQAIALVFLATALGAFAWDGWRGQLPLPPRALAPFGRFVSKNHFAGYVELTALLAVGLAAGLADVPLLGPGR